jgi:hypothetical protein
MNALVANIGGLAIFSSCWLTNAFNWRLESEDHMQSWSISQLYYLRLEWSCFFIIVSYVEALYIVGKVETFLFTDY